MDQRITISIDSGVANVRLARPEPAVCESSPLSEFTRYRGLGGRLLLRGRGSSAQLSPHLSGTCYDFDLPTSPAGLIRCEMASHRRYHR